MIGTDDNPRYRVYQDVSGMPKGSLLEYRVVAKALQGRYSATSTYGFVGDAGRGFGRGRHDRRMGGFTRSRAVRE